MLDYLVLYNSESGNTKKLAASVFSAIPGNSKDLIDITTDKAIPEAKVYFIGFCIHRGTCRLEVSDFINSLNEKSIALFGTCGMGNSPDYYRSIEHSVNAWIESDNKYLGAYLCQGKMPLQIRQRYESLKNDENRQQMEAFIHNFDEAITHPDKQDLDRAETFVAECLRKLM